MAPEKFRIKQIPKELRKQEIWSRRAYVDWVNDKLKAHYTNALEFRNGAAYIQLFDSMFPGVIPMDEVKFCANMEYDCYQNFRILEEAFKKLGIDKNIDTDALSSGRHVESWSFLKWFKLFYDINFDGKDYDPLKERHNAYMGFGRSGKNFKDDILGTQRGKGRKSLSHARSKSVVFQRGNMQSKDYSNEKDFHKVEKTCRSVECIHHKRDIEFGYGRSASPISSKRHGTDRFNCRGKLKFIKATSEDTKEKSEKESDPTNSTKTVGHGGKVFEDLVLVRKGNSQGDFEPKFSKNEDGTSRAQPAQVSNLNAIVVNKSQKYEEFGVRITENIQIRIEKTKDLSQNTQASDTEKRRKMNVMIEKFLKYQWNERKEYFQTLAEFLREDDQKRSK